MSGIKLGVASFALHVGCVLPGIPEQTFHLPTPAGKLGKVQYVPSLHHDLPISRVLMMHIRAIRVHLLLLLQAVFQCLCTATRTEIIRGWSQLLSAFGADHSVKCDPLGHL